MLRLRIPTVILFGWLLVAGLYGCGNPPPTITNWSEADKQYLKICKEEFKYDVVLKSVGGTVWIYLPMKESVLLFKAGSTGGESPTPKPLVQFLESKFLNNNFSVEYDMTPVKTKQKDLGYQSAYSEEFQKKQNNLLNTIMRAYFDVKDGPEFFVVVMADIVNGIEFKAVVNAVDFKKAMSNPPALSPEEYGNRYISEITGNEATIGDTTGKHLDFKEVAWTDFLARQIQNRIYQKYQHSSFPPSEDNEDEILQIINTTLSTYQFTNFNSIKLRDLHNGKDYIFDKSQLGTFAK